jgi:NDP-hexose-3-ketoreductase
VLDEFQFVEIPPFPQEHKLKPAFRGRLFCCRPLPRNVDKRSPGGHFPDMAETAENRVLSVGVHGVGDHARRTVLPAIDACPNLRLAGVSTRSADTRETVGTERNCDTWDSLDAMLANAELDAVLVSSPIACHFADGAKVLAAGVNLWSEKAFTRTLDEARTLHARAAEADLSLCVSLAPAHHTMFTAIRDLLADGAIGRPRDIHGHFGFPHVERSRTLYDPELGGGALLDMGYYPLVIAACLTGETPEVVGARLGRDGGYDVDTEGAALLAFPSGVQASLQWGYGRDYTNELSIVGENGTLLARPAFSKPAHLPVKLEIRRQNEIEAVTLAPCNQFAEMLADFAAAVDDAGARRTLRDQALAHQSLLTAVARRAGES